MKTTKHILKLSVITISLAYIATAIAIALVQTYQTIKF